MRTSLSPVCPTDTIPCSESAEREILEDCLREYYLIPKIFSIDSYTEKFGLLTLFTQTDSGPVKIEIRNIMHSIKLLYGTRVLIRDGNDNRYEIPDLNQLDRKSRTTIELFL